MILSIVIPVYNVEQYLEKCLLSVVNQDIDKSQYEVVVVNDGSPDSCNIILDNFDWQGTIHTVIVQENQGLSAARNKGLSVARGRYIWFIDSDDWIEDNCLSSIVNNLNVDIFSFASHYKNVLEKCTIDSKNEIEGSGSIFTSHEYWLQAQFYIFKKEFLYNNNLFFKKGVFHEDTQFTPRALYLACKIYVYRDPIYHYLCRPGSIMQSISSQNMIDIMSNLTDLLLFLDEKVLSDDKLSCAINAIVPITNEMLYLTCKSDDVTLKKQVCKFVNNHKQFSYYMRNCYDKTIKILGVLSLLCGNNLYLAYKILYPLRYNNLVNAIKS